MELQFAREIRELQANKNNLYSAFAWGVVPGMRTNGIWLPYLTHFGTDYPERRPTILFAIGILWDLSILVPQFWASGQT